MLLQSIFCRKTAHYFFTKQVHVGKGLGSILSPGLARFSNAMRTY